MNKIADLEKELNQKLEEIKKSHKNKIKVFTISSTAKLEKLSYFTPLRCNDNIVIIGIVTFSIKDIVKFKNIINKKFNYIFLDNDASKLKHESVNIYNLCKKMFSKEKIVSYKPNDITVEACWNQVFNFSSQIKNKVLIVGIGNIGTKLAIKLYESGLNIYATRNNHLMGKNTIKFIKKFIKKSDNFIKYEKSFDNVLNDVNVIISCASKNHIIGINSVKKIKSSSVIIELGKNNLTPDAVNLARRKNITTFRLDISMFMLSHIDNIINFKRNQNILYGRKKFKKYYLVSGGYIGYEGDIVVDNFKKPRYIFGIANGSGDFKSRINQMDYKIGNIILGHKIK
tara:strand:- start:3972 stop:4997 length:1026 start_codon:yes stop_codon:yes gene_type:complete